MKYFLDYLLYTFVNAIGWIVRKLPLRAALHFGRFLGLVGYYVDVKHKILAYANLKIAFARTKKPSVIKQTVKQLFKNFGQNFVELLRLPLIHGSVYPGEFVKIEGEEHIKEALKKEKGVILLAMHFGSWELSSLMGMLVNHPYKVITNPQKRFSRLDSLLNSYREGSGSSVISRGLGTRDLIKSLRNNEIIGMVVDQGGKDGSLVKFFGRQASLSTGAIRLGLKYGVPICFSIILRGEGGNHCFVINRPLELISTGNLESDISSNLEQIVRIMEDYITQYPADYMWFYKIWKYSKESATIVLNDGKTGHLRQSQAVAKAIDAALAEREIKSTTQIVDIRFKNRLAVKLSALLGFISHRHFCQGRLRYLKWFLTKESFRQVASIKADFVVSCGSSVAGVNFLLSQDCRAKSIAILKPGILSFNKFHLVVLPQHDIFLGKNLRKNVVQTFGALNLIDNAYLQEQTSLLSKRFTQVSQGRKVKIGILLGGDSKKHVLTESQLVAVISGVKEAAQVIDADIFFSTSRRTSARANEIVKEGLKGYGRCRLLITKQHDSIPEAVGGILGLSDIIIVSGDSISMVCEAASAGKNTIVFSAQRQPSLFAWQKSKHDLFVEKLHQQGFVYVCNGKNISQCICDAARGKIKTRTLNDQAVIFEAARKVI